MLRTMGPGKNNFALSGWPFWPPASLFARFRPTAGVCASLTPRWRPKFLRRKTRIYFCAVPNLAIPENHGKRGIRARRHGLLPCRWWHHHDTGSVHTLLAAALQPFFHLQQPRIPIYTPQATPRMDSCFQPHRASIGIAHPFGPKGSASRPL